MDEDAFDDYDRELELALFREYRDVVGQSSTSSRPSAGSTSPTR